MERRIVSRAFYQLHIEEEIKERGMDWTFKGTQDKQFDDFMDEIEKRRAVELYEHKICTDDCKKRGCEAFTVEDGVWKLRHPHCMWPVTNKATNIPGVKLPDVCVKEPGGQNEAFCREHAILARRDKIPTGLRPFLKDFCGVQIANDEAAYSSGKEKSVINIKDVDKVAAEIQKINPDCNEERQLEKAQGIQDILQMARSVNLQHEEDSAAELAVIDGAPCNKDTGDTQKVLRKWSRGILHFVRGGGHIEKWCPIYKSESPSQVLLVTLQYLYQRLKDVDPAKWHEFCICYDNMCNLCHLKVSQQPLPLPAPYDKLWIEVSKFIDDLHLKNHKRPECKELYSTDRIRDQYPDLNTPVCEQTFTWASKFKKILCAMPKQRFLFFYHRMVVLRNAYTEQCYCEGRKPLLPSIKLEKKNNDAKNV